MKKSNLRRLLEWIESRTGELWLGVLLIILMCHGMIAEGIIWTVELWFLE
jgi:hypothetical protein